MIIKMNNIRIIVAAIEFKLIGIRTIIIVVIEASTRLINGIKYMI